MRTRGTIVPLWEEGRAQRREFEITHRGFFNLPPPSGTPSSSKRESLFFVCFNLLSRFAPAPLTLKRSSFFVVCVVPLGLQEEQFFCGECEKCALNNGNDG